VLREGGSLCIGYGPPIHRGEYGGGVQVEVHAIRITPLQSCSGGAVVWGSPSAWVIPYVCDAWFIHGSSRAALSGDSCDACGFARGSLAGTRE
jgi:hypothetical protein